MSAKTIGFVSGRFQPFHLGHLQYVRRALDQVDQLIVGITNPDPSSISPAQTSAHRHLGESNPYSYLHRQRMITSAILQSGVDGSRFSVVPLALSRSSDWPAYIPVEATGYFVVFSDWEAEKAGMFSDSGYKVVIWRMESSGRISATKVRELMRAGDPSWTKLVPEAVAAVLTAERLIL